MSDRSKEHTFITVTFSHGLQMVLEYNSFGLTVD